MLPNINIGDLWLDCLNFLPEFLACGGIVLFLLLRLFDRSHMGTIALLVTVLALGVSIAQWSSVGPFQAGGPNARDIAHPVRAFGGLLVYDHLTIFLRCFLYGFTAFIIWLSLTTGIPDREDSADFYCLLLGATVGMVIMASATHLLMVYIGIEMASLPSYALAGYLKGRRQSSEAALKYVVYGGGAAGVMLYGISLLAGRFGTAYLPDVAAGLMYSFSSTADGVFFDPILILGVLFILIGVAFKLAAVPFHFWCPDVFEGASAEVAGYLSVASKGAALALLARFTLILGGVDGLVEPVESQHWDIMVRYLIPALAFFAALTATFGNLAAYLQNNLKRLLAYSTIAHAGYMMMGLAALRPTAGTSDRFEAVGLQAVLFYLVAYLFMNLGAFGVVAYLRNQTGSENLEDYRGLVRRSPWMVVTLSIFLLSLLGLPPLVGFTAKFQIFAALWDCSQAWYAKGNAGLGATLFGLLIIGGINSVVSAVYYIKVLKVMILEGRAEDLEGREPVRLREPLSAVAFSLIVALFVVVLGILWAPLDKYSQEGADRFVQRKTGSAGGPAMGGGGGGPQRPGSGRAVGGGGRRPQRGGAGAGGAKGR
ncbi:MAG TPA: NADH-quinone oxidoreductase subunit N [Gemmataceae bacterium]|nr:NADH-quinone oxidoreductase subunit N [Gemmataceae bacterium]